MKFQELKQILKRLYKEYISKHLKRIFLALFLSILVAGSTSSIAWLLDPAVKKIFIDQDRTLAWLIIFDYTRLATKGLTLYFARINIIRFHKKYGEIQKDFNNILFSDIKTIDNRHSGKYISNIMYDFTKSNSLLC